MTRELLILRHAKSAWDTPAPTDYERPLANRGRKAAPRVGRFLKQKGWVPDYLVSSPAERARQTVVLTAAEMGISPTEILWDERIYGGWTSALVSTLRDSPASAHRVLIAGHNPGLEGLLQYLCNERVPYPADGKLLPTAAVARLTLDTAWDKLDKGSARLHSITRVRSLVGF